jgi:hypothetical protein
MPTEYIHKGSKMLLHTSLRERNGHLMITDVDCGLIVLIPSLYIAICISKISSICIPYFFWKTEIIMSLYIIHMMINEQCR